jgi:hypothetical protein
MFFDPCSRQEVHRAAAASRVAAYIAVQVAACLSLAELDYWRALMDGDCAL